MSVQKKTKRPAHIEKAIKELRTFARSEMAKNQIVQFRVDDSDFERLVRMATEKQCPIGTMVRAWVFESLDQEESSLRLAKSTGVVRETPQAYEPRSPVKRPNESTDSLQRQVDSLEKKVDSYAKQLRAINQLLTQSKSGKK